MLATHSTSSPETDGTRQVLKTSNTAQTEGSNAELCEEHDHAECVRFSPERIAELMNDQHAITMLELADR
ncbi:hypothetical protein GCM10010471_27640 [Leucobacter komagatae]